VFFGSVEVALAEFGNLSDREIAKVCAVSDPFVGRLRGQVCSEHTSPSDKRLGADGKTRKLPAKQAVGNESDAGGSGMLPRFSEPLAHSKSCSFDEAAHDKFVKELVALGDKAVAAAGKAGKRKAKTAAAGVIEQYRALSGAARTAYFKANGAALFAAVKAGK
jgi:hypothetical protein